MSQHSQRTQFGPSRVALVAGAALVTASAVATAYMINGPEMNVRVVLGFLMGAGFTGLSAAYVLVMAGDRAVGQERARALREVRAERGYLEELNQWRNATGAILDAYLNGQVVDFQGEPVPDYVRTRLEHVFTEPAVYPEPVDRSTATEPAVYPEPEPDVAGWLRDPVGDVAPLAPPTYPEPVEPVVDQAVARYLDEEMDPLGYTADPARPWSPAEEHAARVLDHVVADYRNPHHEPPYDRHTMPTWNAFEPSERQRAALERVPVPLPPRDGAGQPYVDPGPYGSFVPVVPGRPDWRDADTEVIDRVRDEDETQVIPAQS